MAGNEEFIDEVDHNGRVIASHPRHYLKERMFMHRVSLIIPVAPGNRILLCRRAKDKHPYPDTWCCAVGGKVASDESDEEAAIREMREELGKVYPIKRVASFIYDEKDYKAIFSLFTTTVAVSVEDFTPDPGEIQYVEAFDLGETLDMIESNPKEFAPTFIPALMELAKVL